MALNLSSIDITNPKQTKKNVHGWEGFFPYYAGFPSSFVERLIDSVSPPSGAVVFDPWNGSGTTTAAASICQLQAWGTDINPVMILVAKARLLPRSEKDSLVSLCREILRQARRLKPILNDPLNNWFDLDTVAEIRAIERSVRRHLVGTSLHQSYNCGLNHISTLASSFLVALFAAVREGATKTRTSNPSWTRKYLSESEKISIEKKIIRDFFSNQIMKMAKSLETRPACNEPNYKQAVIEVADTAISKFPSAKVDIVITSPPYCTRIDYTAATRLEIAIVSPWLNISRDKLSASMLGSVRVPKSATAVEDDWGLSCKKFLQKVRNHQSKASSGYYYKNHLDYFDKLHKSIKNISSTIKSGGLAAFVVQDSYYKDIHNPVHEILFDICKNNGLREFRRQAFVSSRSMSSVNQKSSKYREISKPVEYVICFERE